MRSVSYGNALTEAVREEMARDERILILGEDAAVGGALGLLTGLADEFGRERVRDTPISEAGFVGAAIGLAATGWRPIVDLMFAPFIWCAMDQVCNQAAKWRYMTGGQAELPIVYLMANGALGGEAAAQHAVSPYSQFMQVPGLKIAIPASAHDAKGLTKTAIRDPNPVLLFEIPRLNGIKGEIPDDDYAVPMGEATVTREGADITVVGIGYPRPRGTERGRHTRERGHLGRSGRPPDTGTARPRHDRRQRQEDEPTDRRRRGDAGRVGRERDHRLGRGGRLRVSRHLPGPGVCAQHSHPVQSEPRADGAA